MDEKTNKQKTKQRKTSLVYFTHSFSSRFIHTSAEIQPSVVKFFSLGRCTAQVAQADSIHTSAEQPAYEQTAHASVISS